MAPVKARPSSSKRHGNKTTSANQNSTEYLLTALTPEISFVQREAVREARFEDCGFKCVFTRPCVFTPLHCIVQVLSDDEVTRKASPVEPQTFRVREATRSDEKFHSP